jgi:hypothetical protein
MMPASHRGASNDMAPSPPLGFLLSLPQSAPPQVVSARKCQQTWLGRHGKNYFTVLLAYRDSGVFARLPIVFSPAVTLPCQKLHGVPSSALSPARPRPPFPPPPPRVHPSEAYSCWGSKGGIGGFGGAKGEGEEGPLTATENRTQSDW